MNLRRRSMSHITVDAVVSLKLKLPPESAAIISEIIIGDRVFAPSGEHQYEIPTNVVATAVDDFEQKIADGAVEKKEQPTKKVTSPAKSKGGGNLRTVSARTTPARNRSRRNPYVAVSARTSVRRKSTRTSISKKRLSRRSQRSHHGSRHSELPVRRRKYSGKGHVLTRDRGIKQ